MSNHFRFSKERELAVQAQCRTVREVLGVFDTCYKMGIYHAYKTDDIGKCKNFLAEIDSLKLDEFKTLEIDNVITHRSWRCVVSQWIYERPHYTTKASKSNALLEIQRGMSRLQGYNAAIIILFQKFYCEGIEAYLRDPNFPYINTFMGKNMVD